MRRDTRAVTDYLKGIAILAVYINHFLDRFVTEGVGGYANGLVAMFFLFSGYGLWFSLDRLAKAREGNLFIAFYRRRFVRIYPLFWVWCILHKFSNGLLGFFGLDFLYPDGPWFVPALVQCYLVAPVMFLLLRRLSFRNALLGLTLGFVILNAILLSLGLQPFRSIGYRGLFFQHVFLFGLGYVLAKANVTETTPTRYVVLSVLFYLFFIQETTPQSLIVFPGKATLFSFLFPFAAFFACYALCSAQVRLPLRGPFRFLGQYTYSVFLFHDVGFVLLDRLGLIAELDTPWSGILIVAILSPLFIFGYVVFEMVFNEFVFGKRQPRNVIVRVRESIATIRGVGMP